METDPLLWLLVLFSGAFLLTAAAQWLKLSRHAEPSHVTPSIQVSAFRTAAGVTGLGFATLGAALLWVAFTRL